MLPQSPHQPLHPQHRGPGVQNTLYWGRTPPNQQFSRLFYPWKGRKKGLTTQAAPADPVLGLFPAPRSHEMGGAHTGPSLTPSHPIPPPRTWLGSATAPAISSLLRPCPGQLRVPAGMGPWLSTGGAPDLGSPQAQVVRTAWPCVFPPFFEFSSGLASHIGPLLSPRAPKSWSMRVNPRAWLGWGK